MNYITHLKELRRRLIRSAFVFIGSFLLLFPCSNTLYSFIATPLLKQLPMGGQLIATEITAPFMVPLKLCFMVALLINIPIFLYQAWQFIAPGLYQRERKLFLPFVIFSCGLFYAGCLFAFYVMCPMALGFFTHSAPKGVQIMTDITHYLDFVLSLSLAAGCAFQVPLITHLLLRLNIVKKEQLIKQRPYVIVAAFVLGMLLTPPDVISQLLLALPMWGLFELGLLIPSKSQKNESELEVGPVDSSLG